jgi:hypothetical protein
MNTFTAPPQKKDYSSIANCLIKIPTIFPGIFEIFRCIQIFFVFTSRFLAKFLSTFCGNLVVKHWPILTRDYIQRKRNTFIHSVPTKQPSRFPRELQSCSLQSKVRVCMSTKHAQFIQQWFSATTNLSLTFPVKSDLLFMF